MSSEIQRLIKIFHETGAIQYAEGEPFILASGKESEYCIDAEPVLLNDEGSEIVGRLVSRKILELEGINNKKYELAGVYWGGAKVADLAAGALGRDYVSMNYKTGEVNGEIQPVEYIGIEDVVTVASSFIKCLNQFIYPRNATMKNTIAIVDRQEGAAENLAALGITHHYFLTKQDLGIL